jgi:transposase-like protein
MEAKTIEFQRWTAKRKAELILELIRGTKKIVDVCREQDLKQSEVEAWMETFLQGGEKCLKVNAEDEQAAHEREVKELRAKIGELVLEIDFRKKLQALNDPEKKTS